MVPISYAQLPLVMVPHGFPTWIFLTYLSLVTPTVHAPVDTAPACGPWIAP